MPISVIGADFFSALIKKRGVIGSGKTQRRKDGHIMSVARRSFSFRPITRFLYSGIFRFAIENQSIIYYNVIENLLPTEYGGAL